MPREFSRTQRVADQIHREIADMLRREVSDPRLAAVTVSAVKISRDLSHAKIYVTFLEPDDGATAPAMQALGHAAGFLRKGLARRIKMRAVPELRFVHDTSVSRGLHLSELIDRAVEHDRRRERAVSDEGDD
ncbi:MAG: 30S ribosome-binding factor RbfA [Gammaproteobacteria bacterium]|nr:30S ribosome-binding factor RbfA [Gammaproteobacteria bacterium]MDJ0870276.1 30S ribosome-binding factor RbfA [Gammaproteobacteria bacterium]MDJ0890319.1 30S ribosome-binding factor RbfA [Gammaproteobacteria bacterium]